jgi:hypothetical protein
LAGSRQAALFLEWTARCSVDIPFFTFRTTVGSKANWLWRWRRKGWGKRRQGWRRCPWRELGVWTGAFGSTEREATGGANRLMCLYRLGPGRRRKARTRTRGLSEPPHFQSKYETKMSASGQLRTPRSVYVAWLDRPSCPMRDVRTRVIRLGLSVGPTLLSDRTRSDVRYPFGSVRWRCLYNGFVATAQLVSFFNLKWLRKNRYFFEWLTKIN